jgi:cytochrome P450
MQNFAAEELGSESSFLDQQLCDDSLFRHADNTAFVDKLDDPIQTVANLSRDGAVIEGKSVEDGQFIEFDGIRLANILVAPSHLEKGVFAALTWDAGRRVFTDPATFSSKCFAEGSGTLWGPNIAGMDPPEHTKFRMIVQLGFVPKFVASWEPTIITPALDRRFASIRSNGRADLVRELTVFFPYEIAGAVVGFDPGDIGFVAQSFLKTYKLLSEPEVAAQASEDLKSYARKLIEARRREPQNDMVSAMAQAEVAGEPIPDDTFVGMVIHLLQGAIDTVFRMSSTIVHLLLSNPDQFDSVKADRALIPNVVEEALRHQGVACMIPRLVMKDVELEGTHMPAGSVVWVMISPINRDASRWNDADRFDISRPAMPHFTFGNGPHSCIGMHLARKELSLFVERLIDELPNLRWDPAVPTPKITGWMFRGPTTLPVVWDPLPN